MNRKTIGIYIHIPFCVRKCFYCDFVSEQANDDVKNNYVNRLLQEIDERAERLCPFWDEKKQQSVSENSSAGFVVDTIFIGGGTPSVLDAWHIKKILCKLEECFDIDKNCECSIEINPGTIDCHKLKAYREAGINRLSIGLQSCNDNELQALGRIHDFKTFEETYYMARKAGFDNINVDLMSSIPEQTEESFCSSLEKVVKMQPEHISVYSLIVEEGTPFYQMDLKLPDEDEERRIYYATGRVLKEYGYEQYEISNYARKGKRCRHNIRYWKCEEYIGFGVAAASFLHGVRWKNTEVLKQYLKNESGKKGKDVQAVTGNVSENEAEYYCEKEYLTPEDKMSEFMFMGLRMNEGISEEDFYERFGCFPEEKYRKVIEKHIQNGLLEKAEKSIKLTDKGRDVCNYVMTDFLL